MCFFLCVGNVVFVYVVASSCVLNWAHRTQRQEWTVIYDKKKKKKLICTMFYNKAVARAKTMDMGNVHMLGGLICVSHCS